jgi:hypothetical protein
MLSLRPTSASCVGAKLAPEGERRVIVIQPMFFQVPLICVHLWAFGTPVALISELGDSWLHIAFNVVMKQCMIVEVVLI